MQREKRLKKTEERDNQMEPKGKQLMMYQKEIVLYIHPLASYNFFKIMEFFAKFKLPHFYCFRCDAILVAQREVRREVNCQFFSLQTHRGWAVVDTGLNLSSMSCSS